MTRWAEPEPIVVPRTLREAVGGHPLVAETLVRRGRKTPEAALAFLDPDAYEPTAPESLPGMAVAADRVLLAVRRGERICVWGDFDVDGQTATTVLVSTLRDLGADVIYHIPVRATESHGIKLPWLREELDKGVQLLITCDTGIDAAPAVAYARERGVDVVITDHHELPATLPEAHAIVNPHLVDEDHPLSALPGVGVAYKLAEAVYARLGKADGPESLLDLVALGIVADVAVQTGDTRYLLQRGLRTLRATPRLGLQELMKVANVNPEEMTEEDIGYALAPRLNALGRLADANLIVDFLTTEDLTQARIVASQLEALNSRRKQMCEQIYAAAERRIERDRALVEAPVLVMADPEWHPGVIGIVANRLAERYRRPAVLLSAPDGELARGSARSIPGCHITEAIATQETLLESFGGHAMAAGVALDPASIEAFRRGLARAVEAQLEVAEVEPVIQVHGYVTLGELSLPLVMDLRRLAPFGPGNPPLVLVARNVAVAGQRVLGRAGHHLRVTVEDEEHVTRNVVWWNWRGAPLPETRFDLAFTLGINEYRGEVSAQIVWEDGKPMAEEAPAVVAVAERAVEILDYRTHTQPEIEVRRARERGESLAVWSEGQDHRRVAGETRLRLPSAQTLVIWSTPPGPEALRIALRRVEPECVMVVGTDSELDDPQTFIGYLIGLVKHALRQAEGRVSVPELAAATGHREITVRKGLALLEARGAIRVESEGALALRLIQPGLPDPERERRATAELREALGETVAYRRLFGKADLARVLSGYGAG
ncbi:MAG: single-stranded-DNA-specific exonuclease RecJ [Anaerolineae bacterium]